jgi:cytochrome c oxidase subunit 4
MNPAPVRTYVAVWIALMALLALTAASAFVHLGAFNSVVNLAVAAAKALLVAAFFMHLRRHASALVRVFAGAALFMLALLFALSGADYATRHIAPAQWSAPAASP